MKNTLNFICEFIGEAMQIKKIFFFFLFIPTLILSQEIDIQSLRSMGDGDLKTYMAQAQEKGYSLDQIKIIAKAQGISDLEIAEFEKRINNLNEFSQMEELDIDEMAIKSSMFGLQDNEVIMEEELVSAEEIIFGSSFFNNPNISTAPSLNIATPESYELGPGDELVISIWGAAENEYSSQITREGYLKIERIGPVYLSGLSMSEAKVKLKNKLSKIYSGINSNYNKVFFDVSLLNNRSIVINITGNVVAPGTYTLSSLTNPLNALYAAGGPSENGSYREVKIIRAGKEVHSVDLYNYFVKGTLKNITLRDQDVILVPTYKNRIYLSGEFKTKGIFELKENESISDLLLYNGGISSSGIKNGLYIERVDGVFKKAIGVEKENFDKFILNDGDNIEAKEVGDEIQNSVTVEGAVMIPGKYDLNKNLNVRSIIKSAGGLKKSALRNRAYIIREIDGFQQEVISIDLAESINLKKTYSLKENDNLIIASIEELTSEKNINISGEVNDPGSFPYFEGATVADLILMAKGITDKGSNSGITIYRSTYDKTQQNPVEEIMVDLSDGLKSLNTSQNVSLEVNDLVVVRSMLGYQSKEFVSVSGLAKNPGDYALKTNNYSIYDLIKDFDGFLLDANLKGVKLKRKIDFKSFDDVLDEEIDEEIDEFVEIGLNIEKILKSEGISDEFNLTLKGGDEIIVPKFDNSIEISGEVQQSTAISYYRGLTTKSAINKSGGFGLNAKKSSVYVVYQNGTIASTRSFLFFKKYPKLLPGSKIFVPEKPEKTVKAGVADVVGYTTSLVSIIALLKSL
jgi:protein involved in polysaccharide export with SLBB domain